MTRNSESRAGNAQFTITRTFDAPRQLVFKAWSDAKYVAQWWGPRGFTTTFCNIDFRVGGTFHYCMRSPDGKDYWNKGLFKEIVVPERIVSTMYFSDASGKFVEPRDYGMEEFPSEMLDVVTLNSRKIGQHMTGQKSLDNPEGCALPLILARFLNEGRVEVDSNVRAARWEKSLGRFVEFGSGRSST